ncbi:MAG: hypothetical protein ACHQT8_04220 [Chlamydiales bacterium]
MEYFSLEYALLSTQSALLGVVTPELRAVVLDIDYDIDELYVRYYYHGEVSEELIDLWDCSTVEIDTGIRGILDHKIERLDHPNPIPLRGKFAYLRKEPTSFQRPAFVMEECSFAYVMLATQNALLAVVTPELRSVIVDFDNEQHTVYIRFYYHGAVSEELIDLWNRAITEVISSMNFAYVLDQGIERIDYPNEMPFRGRYAYLRKE